MEGNNNKVAIWIVVIIIVIAGIWLIARDKGETTQELSGEPIKIGFIGPLTGDVSALGSNARAATELAIKEINDAGGINGMPVSAVYEDGKCNAGASSNAANKLIGADKVDAIIGGACSTETAAFVQTAMQAKVLTMSYCSSAPNLTGSGKYFFRDYPSDAFQGKVGAEYAYNTMGARKVAILYHISDWGTGLKDVFSTRFTELGGEVVVVEGTPQDVRDYRTAITKIKAANPDLIYVPLYTEGMTAAINQMFDLGIKTRLLGADTGGDPKFQKDVAGKADLTFTIGKTDSTPEFQEKLKAVTGEEQVPVCAAQAYDATKIVAQAIASVGVDPDKLADEIRQVKYDGVSGHIEFDQNGDMTIAEYTIMKLQGDSAVEIE